MMVHGGYRHVPIVDGDHAVGIVSIRDLLGSRARRQAACSPSPGARHLGTVPGVWDCPRSRTS